MSIRLLHGDCREVLKSLPDASVHCCVTSPPYWGLRSYLPEGHADKHLEIGSEPTLEAWVATMVEVFREVRRVLREDGTLWLNLGDAYAGSRCGGSGWPGSTLNGAQPDHSRAAKHQVFTAAHKDASAGAKRAMTASARRDNEPIPRSDVRVGGLKPKDMMGQPWRVAFALQADGWWLRQEIIWCLSGGAAVYARTQKGDMPVMVKDLVRLRPETVKLWNGEKWTQALGWSRSVDTDGALEIELRSGERIGCTRGHQWPTARGLLRADELAIGDVLDSTQLPEPDAPTAALAFGRDVAWLCGLYLAEGSMSGDKVQLAGHTDETEQRLSRIEGIAAAFHGAVRVHTNGNTANIVISGPVIAAVIRTYVHGDCAANKGLKVRAWARDNAWLAAFLDGYLAGDGHYDAKNDRWRLGFTRNDRLADDFRTLAARLGLSLRLAATTATGFGKEWPIYRGDVRLTRTTHHNARVDTEVVAIRASRARQFWDIGVADEPHLFALASGVLTHNSKRNPMPESIRDRFTKAHEHVFLLSKSQTYYFDFDAVQEPVEGGAHARRPGNKNHSAADLYTAGDEHHRTKVGLVAYAERQRAKPPHNSAEARRERANVSAKSAPTGLHNGIRALPQGVGRRQGPPGNPAEAPVSPKAALASSGKDGAYSDGKSERMGRGAGWRNNKQNASDEAMAVMPATRNPRSVRWLSSEPFKGAHFATYPPELIEPFILAGCPEGGTVLDPFGGSGTTGLVADRYHRSAIMIDLDERNGPMAEARIRGDSPLFAEVAT